MSGQVLGAHCILFGKNQNEYRYIFRSGKCKATCDFKYILKESSNAYSKQFTTNAL